MRNSFPRYYGRHLRILSAEKYFTVGCGKANCGNAAREGALGYDLGAPFVSALHNLFRSGPRNALSNVFRANNVRPYGYAPANLFDAVRRGRRTLRCTVKSFGSIYRVERHKVNCPKDRRSHTGVPRRATHLYIASPQGQSFIFYSQLLLRIRKKHRFRGAFSLSIKSIYRFYFSCGSTHKIEFAQQIHNSRGRGPGHPLLPLCGNSPCVPRELYKGRKIVPVGRGFSSRFD